MIVKFPQQLPHIQTNLHDLRTSFDIYHVWPKFSVLSLKVVFYSTIL